MPAYKEKDKNTWFVQMSIKGLDGKFHGRTKRGFSTKREALAWEAEEKRKMHGTLDMSFESFTDLYLENIKTRIKESTYQTKVAIIKKHITPYFKNKRVNEITKKDIMEGQTLMMNMTWDSDNGDAKFKSSYLKTVHNQLNAILNFAKKYYDLPVNPAHVVGNMGTDRDVKISFWTKEQYLKFKEAMADEPIYYYAFECLYWLGIREGEMLALTPKDFDFENNKVNIDKTYMVIKGKAMVTSPKTRKSIRKVTMPKFLADEIKDLMRFEYDPDSNERLFPLSKSMLTRALQRGTKKADLPKIRVHDLRHSHASLLIDMGFSPVAIAQRLGHESIHVTYRYSHLFPSVQNELAKKLDEDM